MVAEPRIEIRARMYQENAGTGVESHADRKLSLRARSSRPRLALQCDVASSWWETLRQRRLQSEAVAAAPTASDPSAVLNGCLGDLQVLDFVEGSASPEARTEILDHVEVCQKCRELIAGLLATSPKGHASTSAPPEVCGGYRFGPKIAEGGMGRIYRAIDTKLGREVAVKVPSTTEPALVRRFEREVAITARLQHPGVVPLHGAGEFPDGTPFYVMQFIDGIRLDQAVDRAADHKARLALLGHLVSIAETMAYVHAEQIAHRDLKPNNVLIGKFGETVIIDWGLAKLLAPRGERTPASRESTSDFQLAVRRPSTDLTHLGDVLGTPAFMSPEQAAGDPIDQRADVYALGVMLSFVVTGTLRPASLADMPAALAAVHARAVAFDVEQRYEDAGAFAAALRKALDHASTRRSRRRLIGTLAVAGMVSAGAVAVAAGVVGTRRPDARVTTTLQSIDREPLGAQWIALSPTGARVAYSCLDHVEIKDLLTNQSWTRPGGLQWPEKVQFESDDLVTFAVGDGADGAGHLVQWNLRTGGDTAPRHAKLEGLWLGRADSGDLILPSATTHRLVVSGEHVKDVANYGRKPIVQLALAPSRRRFAFVDALTTTSSAIRIIDGAVERTLVSPPISDLTALAWLDDETLLYATGSTNGSKLYRATATAAGLVMPAELYSYGERDSWIGALASANGRIVMSLVASTFETHVSDRTATLVDDRLDPVSASAPLGWRDASGYFTWNRATNDVELRSVVHGTPAVRQSNVHGEPANVTRAGEMLIVTSRAEKGRRVEAIAIGEAKPRWSAAPGSLWFVRCAGDNAEPCVAGAVTDGQISIRAIDPRSGALGKVIVSAADIEDAAIDADGANIAWIVASSEVEIQPLTGTTPAPLAVASHLSSAHSIAFAPHGGVLVSRAVGNAREIVRLYAGGSETLVRTGATIISMIRPSPDGDRLLYRTRTLNSELAELRLGQP